MKRITILVLTILSIALSTYAQDLKKGLSYYNLMTGWTLFVTDAQSGYGAVVLSGSPAELNFHIKNGWGIGANLSNMSAIPYLTPSASYSNYIGKNSDIAMTHRIGPLIGYAPGDEVAIFGAEYGGTFRFLTHRKMSLAIGYNATWFQLNGANFFALTPKMGLSISW